MVNPVAVPPPPAAASANRSRAQLSAWTMTLTFTNLCGRAALCVRVGERTREAKPILQANEGG